MMHLYSTLSRLGEECVCVCMQIPSRREDVTDEQQQSHECPRVTPSRNMKYRTYSVSSFIIPPFVIFIQLHKNRRFKQC